MTRLLSTGFEMQDTIGWTVSVSGVTINTSIYRSGAASLGFAESTTTAKTAYYVLPSATAEGYIRFGLYISGYSPGSYNHSYMAWYKGGTILGSIRFAYNNPLRICNSAGTIVATGTTLLLQNIWYLIEIHVKIADSGNYDVKIEGLTEASLAYSGDTKPGADADFDRILFYIASQGVVTNSYSIDDIGLNDTAGGADDSWCGEGKIIRMYPNDDVTTELTQYPALTDHHADVDEVPADGDTTYVQGTVVDEEDLYELTASGLVAADVDNISRVWVESRTKDTTATGGTALLFISSNAVVDDGPDVTLTTSYDTRVSSGEFLQDPDGPAAWDVAALDALRAGVRTRS